MHRTAIETAVTTPLTGKPNPATTYAAMTGDVTKNSVPTMLAVESTKRRARHARRPDATEEPAPDAPRPDTTGLLTSDTHPPGRTPRGTAWLPYNLIAGKSLDWASALGDGLFTMAMTLLVLDLRVPLPATVRSGGSDSLSGTHLSFVGARA